MALKGINVEGVAAWYGENVPGASLPLSFEMIVGGHSNLTFAVTDAEGSVTVLRRPPTGHLLSKAHDMSREHRVISAFANTEVPVPATIGLCEDLDVNQAPFYVMSFVEGWVPHDDEVMQLHVPHDERFKLGESVIEVLAALHNADVDSVGLSDLGRREDYVARQLRRWYRAWNESKTRELPAMDALHEALSNQMPMQIGATVVHGDYRFGNMIVNDGFQVAAVLDWELCTLGDPLSDLGYLMNNWASPDEPVLSGVAAPTQAGGFPTRDDMLERYAKLTGRDVTNIGYYRAFNYWRLAAIVEGVLARYMAGQMGEHDDLDLFRAQVERLTELALEALDSGDL
jgi:aminoglycoside phosphotransferase (APT) family kinase protein